MKNVPQMLSAELLFIALSGSPMLATHPLEPVFTYHGRLTQSGTVVDETADLQFRLFDAPDASAQVGPPQTARDVDVRAGLFTITLDFGAAAFNGEPRWLEVAVRSPAGRGSFATFAPRQALIGVAYASVG